MIRTLSLLALGTVLAAIAHASPPVTSGAVVVPYYGATYGQPAGLSAGDGKRIVELLESIDRRLEAIEQKQFGSAPLKKAPELLAVARQHCASCHTPAKADVAGGGYILFGDDQAGALRILSGRDKTRIAESVQAGTMPPDGRKKLTAAERAAFKW